MPTFAEIRASHPDWDGAFPSDWTPPTRAELDGIQADFGIHYPADYVEFQLVECLRTPMGDTAWDGFGWANPSLEAYVNLRSMVQDAREMGVGDNLAPFRVDNADYWCFTQDGSVVIWDHNQGGVDDDARSQWPSFTAWWAATLEDEE